MGLFRTPFYSRKGPIRILARHKVLHQLGLDILEGLSQADLQSLPDTIVLVGCHHSFNHPFIRLLARNSTFVLGVQTEQFFDANRKLLWGAPKTENVTKTILKNLSFVNAFLDLSEHNMEWYLTKNLPQKDLEKLRFGPSIFPTEERTLCSKTHQDYIFFGSLNDRRRQVLNALGLSNVNIVHDGTFGKRLANEILKSRAVLNLHYSEGVYSEAPRLLTSYLARKPVVSEELAGPFKAGVHYISVENNESETDSRVYANFSKLVTEQLSFAEFLRAITRERSRNSIAPT